MTTADAADLVKSLPWYWVVLGPVVIGAAITFVVARLSFTKKERADYEQVNYANTTKLLEQYDAAYDKYTAAIHAYTAADTPTFELFKSIAVCGDLYFNQACLMSDAIMSGKVDCHVRDNTLVPKIVDVAERSLPKHYDTLTTIAEAKGWSYSGELRRKDYRSIYAVVEKFHRGDE